MAFTFKLEHEDGTPADSPVLHTARAELERWRGANGALTARQALRERAVAAETTVGEEVRADGPPVAAA